MMAPAVDVLAYFRAHGILSLEDAERLDALRQSQYCLVRIDGMGERWRCRRCNGRHTHFSLFCVERPFRGLEHALFAYWRNVGAGDAAQLSARQRARVREVGAIFGVPSTPNLSTLHPRTAQALGGDAADTDLGADLLGTLDPISPMKATLLANLINSRARQTVIRL